MPTTRTYRCLNCLEHTVTRDFDVSHISTTYPRCELFERLVNETVYEQFEAFKSTPPDALDWDRLDRMEKLVVSERVARKGQSIEDIGPVD